MSNYFKRRHPTSLFTAFPRLKQHVKHGVTCALLSVTLSLANTFALADTNDVADETEVISVTASKQARLVSQTPDSVTVLLGEEIQALAPQHISQVLSQAPGTWISRGNGQEHLTAIRSPVLTGAGSCGAFFMGLDGISIRAPGFCNANQLFDVNYEQAASIDVLRSPASTLYGANALHGVINVVSHDTFNAPQNALSLRVGTNDFARLSGVYGQASSDSAFLALGNLTQENGYQENSGYDQQKLTSIYQQNGPVWQVKAVLDINNLNQETAGFIRGFESFKDSTARRSNPNPEAFRDAKSMRLYASFVRATQVGELTLKPYVRANSMAFLQHFLPWQALEENSHNSAGLQTSLQASYKDIEWLIGTDIDITNGSLKETQAEDFSPSIPAGVHYDYEVDARQIAMYAQASYIVNKWEFRLGARAEQNRYDYTNLTESNSACEISVEVCRFSRPDSQVQSFNAISPSVNVSYVLNDNVRWYAKYFEGFRAPQASELFRLQNNQQITDIDNEEMDAFEIGVRWSNNTTSAHVALYDMDKSDVIFQDSNRQNVTGARTSHKGAELEIRTQLSDRVSINGHISYAKHRYENSTRQIAEDITGNEIDTAPKLLGKINANYQFNDALSAQLSWQHISDYYLDPQNTAKYDGHELLDLHVYYKANPHMNLSLHVINLLDEAYAERADFAFGSYRYFVGQPARAFINFQWLF